MEKVFININGSVDDDMLNSFIKLHEQSKLDYKDKNIVCYFRSSGGDTAIGRGIIDIINNIDNFTLVAQGEISSCGFDIFFISKCKKKVSPICTGMCHIGGFNTNINHCIKKKQWASQRVAMEDIKISSNKNAKFYKKMGMKKQDLKQYKQDNDINYSSRQLKMFVNNQKKIGYIPE